MTSFVVSSYPTEHPGVARFEAAAHGWGQLRRWLASSQGLATVLLAGLAAAVLVVAFQVMDSLAEGHLLVIWMGGWLAGFAALALLAAPSRQLAGLLIGSLRSAAQRRAQARCDAQMWSVARLDPRLINELMIATQRDHDVCAQQG